MLPPDRTVKKTLFSLGVAYHDKGGFYHCKYSLNGEVPSALDTKFVECEFL